MPTWLPASAFADPGARRGPGRVLDVVTEPLQRAQRAGTIRSNLEPRDPLVLLDMLSGAARAGVGREQRALALLLDALHPT